MRIFFYGGTFDPPHNGHESIINYCLNKCDKLILVPNKKSPHKANKPYASFVQRKKMLNILFGHHKIKVSEFESKSLKENYTYLTINYLKKKYKTEDITMVIGSDQLFSLNNWENIDYILNQVKILCFNRERIKNKKINIDLKYNLKFIEDFNINISSSYIRSSISNKSYSSIVPMVNENVLNYIKQENLYV